jgi:holo-[acyl-carrier protein] synthase
MVKGIGIDIVNIEEIRSMLGEDVQSPFARRTFTAREIEESAQAGDKAEYFAGRYAVKEAVFKAVAHLLEEKGFDFRCVETIDEPGGRPVVQHNDKLAAILDEASVHDVQVSISNDSGLAVAVAVVE